MKTTGATHRFSLLLVRTWAGPALGPAQVQESWALLAQLGFADPFSLGQAQSDFFLKYFKNKKYI